MFNEYMWLQSIVAEFAENVADIDSKRQCGIYYHSIYSSTPVSAVVDNHTKIVWFVVYATICACSEKNDCSS